MHGWQSLANCIYPILNPPGLVPRPLCNVTLTPRGIQGQAQGLPPTADGLVHPSTNNAAYGVDTLLSLVIALYSELTPFLVVTSPPRALHVLRICSMLSGTHAGTVPGLCKGLESKPYGSRCRRPACGRLGRIVATAQPDDSQEAQRPLPNREQYFIPPADNRPPRLVGDWRAFRAQLVAQEQAESHGVPADLLAAYRPLWAHEIAVPEKGCLLVARREGLGMFHSAVILMLEHDDQQGSSGLVINYPTPLLISNLGLEEDIAESFGRSPLYIGGPVTKNLLHVLHGRRDVEGALEILDGVYAGGVESAAELVRRGEAAPGEFRLLAGYSGWGPWQLRQELEAGTWWAVAASQQLILEVLTDNSSGVGAGARRGEVGMAAGAGAVRPHADVLKRRCWERVLQAAGIDYSILQP